MHTRICTYRSVTELAPRRLFGGGSRARISDCAGTGRDGGPPAEDEARAISAVGLGMGTVVGLRHVDPPLLPLPHWATEHCGGWAVPRRCPAQSRPNSLHRRTPPDSLALRRCLWRVCVCRRKQCAVLKAPTATTVPLNGAHDWNNQKKNLRNEKRRRCNRHFLTKVRIANLQPMLNSNWYDILIKLEYREDIVNCLVDWGDYV